MITLKELAAQIGGKYWEKGDLKRIYLDRGHNTKKMSTKTYVYQGENGQFKVNCFVDCPSQPYQWCTSQAEEVKDNVWSDIQEAIAEKVYIVKIINENTVDKNNEVTALNDLECGSGYVFTQEAAENLFTDLPASHSIVEVAKSEFDAERKRLDEIQEATWAKERAARQPEKSKDPVKVTIPTSTTPVEDIAYGVGANVIHQKLGSGIVIEEDAKYVRIDFGGTVKNLIKKFTKVTVVENADQEG